jgi:hypothetical protein
MRIKLDERWIKLLLALPESGMGYQRIDLRLDDGRELRDVKVFNAEEAELPSGNIASRIADIRIHEG